MRRALARLNRLVNEAPSWSVELSLFAIVLGAFLLALSTCSCSSEQLARFASGVTLKYGTIRSDGGEDAFNQSGHPAGVSGDGDSSYVEFGCEPFKAWEPPQRTIIENLPQPYRPTESAAGDYEPARAVGADPAPVDSSHGSEAATAPAVQPAPTSSNSQAQPPAGMERQPIPPGGVDGLAGEAAPISWGASILAGLASGAIVAIIGWFTIAPDRLAPLRKLWGALGRFLAFISKRKTKRRR